jgi:hypothetical protein
MEFWWLLLPTSGAGPGTGAGVQTVDLVNPVHFLILSAFICVHRRLNFGVNELLFLPQSRPSK